MTSNKEPFLTIFCGPMFAGKTTKLHTQMTEYKFNRTGYSVICINHGENIRYGTSNSITHKQALMKLISNNFFTSGEDHLDINALKNNLAVIQNAECYEFKRKKELKNLKNFQNQIEELFI